MATILIGPPFVLSASAAAPPPPPPQPISTTLSVLSSAACTCGMTAAPKAVAAAIAPLVFTKSRRLGEFWGLSFIGVGPQDWWEIVGCLKNLANSIKLPAPPRQRE